MPSTSAFIILTLNQIWRTALQKSDLAANLDVITRSLYTRIPELSCRRALVQNKANLNKIDDCLHRTDDESRESPSRIERSLQSKQKGNCSEPAQDQADDGHDLADPAPEIAPHQIAGRQQTLMIANTVDDADSEEALGQDRRDLVENIVRSDRDAQRPQNPVPLEPFEPEIDFTWIGGSPRDSIYPRHPHVSASQRYGERTDWQDSEVMRSFTPVGVGQGSSLSRNPWEREA